MLGRRRIRRRGTTITIPFTPDEDEWLRKMNDCGLATEFWSIPGRTLGELLERRVDLNIKPPRLL